MQEQIFTRERSDASSKTKKVAYWIFTVLVVFELLLGATWDFNCVNKSLVRSVMNHLGYPAYFDILLGLAKIPAAIVLLMPGVLILKEWAYAGSVFIFAGAAVSHLAVGDGAGGMIFPALYAALTLGSWWLRPGSRRIR